MKSVNAPSRRDFLKTASAATLAALSAGGNVNVTSLAGYSVSNTAHAIGGGVVSDATANAIADVTHNARANVGDSASITAGGDMNIA